MARTTKVNVLPSYHATGKWFVRVTAPNGKTVFSGETINSKAHAVRTAETYAPPGADVVVHNTSGDVVKTYSADSIRKASE